MLYTKMANLEFFGVPMKSHKKVSAITDCSSADFSWLDFQYLLFVRGLFTLKLCVKFNMENNNQDPSQSSEEACGDSSDEDYGIFFQSYILT